MSYISDSDLNSILNSLKGIVDVLERIKEDKPSNNKINANSKSVRVSCVEAGVNKVFDSITEAANYLKMPRKTLAYHLDGDGIVNIDGVIYVVTYYVSNDSMLLP